MNYTGHPNIKMLEILWTGNNFVDNKLINNQKAINDQELRQLQGFNTLVLNLHEILTNVIIFMYTILCRMRIFIMHVIS